MMRQGRLKNLAVVFVFAIGAGELHGGEGWYSSFEEAQAAAAEQDVPLLIHFHASWCGPCRQMASQVLGQSDVQSRLRKGLAAVEVDVSQRPDLAKKYSCATVPRDIVVEPDGTFRTANVGFKSVAAYSAMLSGISREPKKVDAPKEPILGLEGFCPVKLIADREWVTGDKDVVEIYRGVTYHLSSEDARKKFLKNPRKFAPQNLGCDPVVLADTAKAITGKINFGAFFDGKLYLFKSDENRVEFKANPLKFTRIQHAIRPDALSGQRFQ